MLVADGSDRAGVIKYSGPVAFSNLAMVGLQLDPPHVGKHSGTVAGQEYFRCPENRGLFLAHHKIAVVPEDEKGVAASSSLPSTPTRPQPRTDSPRSASKANAAAAHSTNRRRSSGKHEQGAMRAQRDALVAAQMQLAVDRALLDKERQDFVASAKSGSPPKEAMGRREVSRDRSSSGSSAAATTREMQAMVAQLTEAMATLSAAQAQLTSDRAALEADRKQFEAARVSQAGTSATDSTETHVIATKASETKAASAVAPTGTAPAQVKRAQKPGALFGIVEQLSAILQDSTGEDAAADKPLDAALGCLLQELLVRVQKCEDNCEQAKRQEVEAIQRSSLAKGRHVSAEDARAEDEDFF